MRKEIESRIEALEEKANSPVISTFCDLVRWVADHEGDEDAECNLSPELQKLADEAAKHDEEEDSDDTKEHKTPARG